VYSVTSYRSGMFYSKKTCINIIFYRFGLNIYAIFPARSTSPRPADGIVPRTADGRPVVGGHLLSIRDYPCDKDVPCSATCGHAVELLRSVHGHDLPGQGTRRPDTTYRTGLWNMQTWFFYSSILGQEIITARPFAQLNTKSTGLV